MSKQALLRRHNSGKLTRFPIIDPLEILPSRPERDRWEMSLNDCTRTDRSRSVRSGLSERTSTMADTAEEEMLSVAAE
jgi:hypothetical protein